MKETVFNRNVIEFILADYPSNREQLAEYNSMRIFVNGKEILPSDNLEVVFYNDPEQNE